MKNRSALTESDGTTVLPLYLFADSQLLFWKINGQLFLKSLLIHLSAPAPVAAYIGASNGDEPAYYDIFALAMNQLGIQRCAMVHSDYGASDQELLERADIILLAGGDVQRGWEIIERTGIKATVLRRYRQGALIIGISAGAVQLGCCALPENTGTASTPFEAFNLVPLIIDVHDEKAEWARLKETMRLSGTARPGVGIRAGAGLIYHADNTLEAVRYSLTELTHTGQEFTSRLILPPDPEDQPAMH